MPNTIKNVDFKVFRINKSTLLVKTILSECRCEFDRRKCNS